MMPSSASNQGQGYSVQIYSHSRQLRCFENTTISTRGRYLAWVRPLTGFCTTYQGRNPLQHQFPPTHRAPDRFRYRQSPNLKSCFGSLATPAAARGESGRLVWQQLASRRAASDVLKCTLYVQRVRKSPKYDRGRRNPSFFL